MFALHETGGSLVGVGIFHIQAVLGFTLGEVGIVSGGDILAIVDNTVGIALAHHVGEAHTFEPHLIGFLVLHLVECE